METTSLPALPETRTPKLLAEWLKRSAPSLPRSQEDADALTMAVDAASTPATPADIGKHALVVISQYFIGDQPAVVREATAAMWVEHLDEFPEWAIRNAVTWWVGPDNAAKARHRRPLPGDIAERCRMEVAPITRARQAVAHWEKYRGAYPSFLEPTARAS